MMGWRDFQLPRAIDNIDNIDNMKSEGHFVDIVDFVYEGNHKTPTRKRVCYWLEEEVQDCRLPCWVSGWSGTDDRTCPHFKKHMIEIGRWSTEDGS